MATKAYKLFQLGREGNSFNLEQRKEIRSSVKIDESLAAIYNANSKDSGKLYVENEEETERLFGKPKSKIITPVIPEVTDSISKEFIEDVKASNAVKVIEDNQPTPEQLKYYTRRDKMFAAGFVLRSQADGGTDMVFVKNNKSILASELLALAPAKFGKLLKS
jgi:hypothetical protein